MGYLRDRDSYTRGVGAIAAIDRAPRRQGAKIANARATLRRDRAMAAVTRGALSGYASLGLITAADGGTYTPQPSPKQPPRPEAPLPPPAAPAGTYFPPPTPPPPPQTLPTNTGIVPPVVTDVPSGVIMGQSPPIYAPRDPMPEIPIIDSPNAPYPNEPDPTVPDTRLRNALLIGGAALAAYWLFFRKGIS